MPGQGTASQVLGFSALMWRFSGRRVDVDGMVVGRLVFVVQKLRFTALVSGRWAWGDD